ncbi:PPC domain-containing DNA-binding protein [Streptomyces sp. NPDC000133]|uniref:PPC domain-containing DNA-binding protein n=1 Tax=Streptomyces sp. NPDC000133 TaxID=3364535 RepID=UPI0036B5464B
MHATQLTIGRTFGVALDDGDDFLSQLGAFCAEYGIRSAFVPMFLGGFHAVQLVGTCDPIDDPSAPVWTATEYTTLEALGSGTIAWDEETNALAPHIHVAVGLKGQAAEGRTSHLLGASVQFISELFVVEVVDPLMTRPKLGPHKVPTLRFSQSSGPAAIQ